MNTAKFLISFFICLIIFVNCTEEDNSFNIKECGYCHDKYPDPHVSAKIMAEDGHNFDCSVCHQGNSWKDSTVHPTLHNDGKGDVVFDTAFLEERFRQELAIQYDPEQETCFNIPCHGYGRVDWDSITGEDENGVWFRGRDFVNWYPNAPLEGELDCLGCHDHSNHRVGHDGGCIGCHYAGSISDSVTLDDFSLHINGYDEPYEP